MTMTTSVVLAHDVTQTRAAAGFLATALRAGAPGVQVTTEGRGEKKPVAPNAQGGKDDPVGRARNRRVAISFTPA